MPKIHLQYFDIAAKAEPTRWALEIAGVEWTEDRIPFAEWPPLKSSTPLGQLPVLTVDGKKYAQSTSMLRYVGKLGGLVPSGAEDELRCDEILESADEAMSAIGATMRMSEAEKKPAREALVAPDGKVTIVLKCLESYCKDSGLFFDKVSIADLWLANMISWLSSGMVDHIPASALDFPKLKKGSEAVLAHEKIAAYRDKHKKN